MSNIIYEHGFYNEAVKNRFLETYDKADTRVTYGRILKNSYYTEDQLGKDLYDFNRDEIKGVLFVCAPYSMDVSKTNAAAIRSYINWAIKEGYRMNNLNPLDGIGSEWYKQFVDKSKETIYSASKIKYIVSKCMNYQDSVIVQLLFEGVGGEGHEELLNLEENHINFETGELELYDKDNSSRKLRVSDECLRLIRGALNETKYIKKNGEFSPNTKSTETNLANNNFVLKTSLTQNKGIGKGGKDLIFRRITTLSKCFGLEYFKPKSIRFSGMLYEAKKIVDRDGVLEKQQYEKFCPRFKVYWHYPLAKEFLNIQTITKLYPDTELKAPAY